MRPQGGGASGVRFGERLEVGSPVRLGVRVNGLECAQFEFRLSCSAPAAPPDPCSPLFYLRDGQSVPSAPRISRSVVT